MEKLILSQSDYKRQLEDTLRLLKEATEKYDQGDFYYAKPIASSIAKLIDDRRKNLSLLNHLGMKPELVFDNSLHKEDRNSPILHGPYLALGFLPIGRNQPIPIFDGFEEYENLPVGTYVHFDEWWNSPIVRDNQGRTLSRKDVVREMRDTEAQHTDSGLNFAYGELAYHGTLSIRGTELHIDRWDDNITHLVVRQTAHELLRTIDDTYPKKYSIKKGDYVHAMSFIEIFYTDSNGNHVPIKNYHGYKFESLWTSSEEAARKWMAENPYYEGFSPPPVFFAGEMKPSNIYPTGIRIAFLNHYPYSPRVKTYYSVSRDGVVTILTVVLNLDKPRV